MACREYKEMMMAFIDGELDAAESQRFEEHISTCTECRRELEEFRKLKKLTDDVSLVEPEDRLWEEYWSSLYNRLERGIGWILMSVAGIVLLIYGGFKMVDVLVRGQALQCWLKIAIIGLIAGIAILLVSILRERLFIRKRDRYRDVRR